MNGPSEHRNVAHPSGYDCNHCAILADLRFSLRNLLRNPAAERDASLSQPMPSYDANDITVLEGLEPVRKRPGHVHRLDRSRAACTTSSGRSSTTPSTRRWPATATRIDVTLLADGGCRVVDNGRGIPVDLQPASTRARPAASRAHHAARRRQVRRRGLQGLRRPPRRRRVGGQRAVDAARSSRSTATASATAWSSPTAASRKAKLEVVGKAPRGRTGTTVTFWPDPTDLRGAPSSAPRPCSSASR